MSQVNAAPAGRAYPPSIPGLATAPEGRLSDDRIEIRFWVQDLVTRERSACDTFGLIAFTWWLKSRHFEELEGDEHRALFGGHDESPAP